MAVALSPLTSTAACAHDFWIAPSSFAPAEGERVDVELYVGHREDRRRVSRAPARIVRFDAIQGETVVPVPGFAWQLPAGIYEPTAAGPVTLAYESTAERIVLAPDKFEEYLTTEGLQDVLAERTARGERHVPGRERFARSCKALLRVGDGGGTPDRLVGLTLELVAETDPRAWRLPELLGFRLAFRGTPLADRLVEMVSIEDPSRRLAARTDRDGRVQFAPTVAGGWMVATVHMQRAEAESDVDWESFWATLTFELPA